MAIMDSNFAKILYFTLFMVIVFKAITTIQLSWLFIMELNIKVKVKLKVKHIMLANNKQAIEKLNINIKVVMVRQLKISIMVMPF